MAKKCQPCEADGSEKGNTNSSRDYGGFLLAMPVITAFLIWLWAGRAMPLSTNALWWIMNTTGFWLMTLPWMIGCAAYLFQRRYTSRKSRTIAAIVITLCLLGNVVGMAATIEAIEVKKRYAAFLRQRAHALLVSEGIRWSLANFAADSHDNLYPTSIPNVDELVTIVNANGGALSRPEMEEHVVFGSYQSSKGEDYQLVLYMKEALKAFLGPCIIISLGGIEKCPAWGEHRTTGGAQ